MSSDAAEQKIDAQAAATGAINLADGDRVQYNLEYMPGKGLCMQGKFEFSAVFGDRIAPKNDQNHWDMLVDTGAATSDFRLRTHQKLLPKNVLNKFIESPPMDWHEEGWKRFARRHKEFGAEDTHIVMPVMFHGKVVQIEFSYKVGKTAAVIGMDLLRCAELMVNDNKQPPEPKSYVIFSKSKLEECPAAVAGRTLEANLPEIFGTFAAEKEKLAAKYKNEWIFTKVKKADEAVPESG